MEKFIGSNRSREVEKEKYQENLSLLESTEGFSLLTEKQQQIIRVSLLLQARAERDMHPKHKNDPWYYDWFENSKYIPKYQDSLEHIKNWYCHVSVNALEECDLSADYPQDCSLEFFDGTYFEVQQIHDLTKAIEFIGFPSVVHVSDEMGNMKGEDTKYHTFVALGHDREGEIVVWEKIRQAHPYRVTNLRQVHSDYSDKLYWGIRKLR